MHKFSLKCKAKTLQNHKLRGEVQNFWSLRSLYQMSDRESAIIDEVSLGVFYTFKGMKKINVKNFNVVF